MRRYRSARLVAVATFLLVASSACNTESSASSSKAVVVLFDLSESTSDPAVREAYCNAFRRILGSVGHGDALSVGWILESSVSQPELPVDTVFPEFDPETTNPLLKRARRSQADSSLQVVRDSLHARVCRMLSSPGRTVMQTDIMTSLDLAASIFEARDRGDQQLIIFSDMVEDSERYQFDQMVLHSERRKEILDREQKARRFPDLTGTKICVVGASAREADRYYQIEKFWRVYFDRSDAEVSAYAGALIGCR